MNLLSLARGKRSELERKRDFNCSLWEGGKILLGKVCVAEGVVSSLASFSQSCFEITGV